MKYSPLIYHSILAILFFIVYFYSGYHDKTPTPIFHSLVMYVIVSTIYLIKFLEEKSKRKWKDYFFKYDIGETTDKGIIKSRYYMESLNRNNGPMSGYYYVMEDDASYNEFLLNRKEEELIDLPY